jgi:hypothetical protein
MEGLQAAADLDHDVDGLGQREGLLLQPVGQRAAIGVRQNQERAAVLQFADVVHLDDVLGLDATQEPALLEEPVPDRVVVRPVVREHLDRHFGIQLLIVSEPYRSETA